jgi:hypothetical protein
VHRRGLEKILVKLPMAARRRYERLAEEQDDDDGLSGSSGSGSSGSGSSGSDLDTSSSDDDGRGRGRKKRKAAAGGRSKMEFTEVFTWMTVWVMIIFAV